jgi:hypothetical protein
VHRDDAEPFIAIGAERVGSARLAFFPIQLHPIGKTPVFCPTTASLREPDSASREIAMTRAGKKRMFPPRPERKRELLASEANPRAPHSHQREARRFKFRKTVELRSQIIHRDLGAFETASETTHSKGDARRFGLSIVKPLVRPKDWMSSRGGRSRLCQSDYSE